MDIGGILEHGMEIEFTLFQLALLGGVGFLGWSFLEYVIHGFLSHRFRTFVTPLHNQHHREPSAVFTSPLAWVPVTGLLFGMGYAFFGSLAAGALVLGLFVGFVRYERLHWRIHFREPRNAREELRRNHHLAHHFCNPQAYCGVTTRFWDRVFATQPSSWRVDYAKVATRPPERGPSNLRSIWNPREARARLALRR